MVRYLVIRFLHEDRNHMCLFGNLAMGCGSVVPSTDEPGQLAEIHEGPCVRQLTSQHHGAAQDVDGDSGTANSSSR